MAIKLRTRCVILLLLLALSGCGSSTTVAHTATTDTPVVEQVESAIAERNVVSSTNAIGSVADNDATFDRRAMLADIVDSTILPRHEQLVAEAVALAEAVQQFAAAPTVETLTQAREQWLTTAQARAQTELFSLRFTMMIAPQIKKWPIKEEFIEEFIASTETIDATFISGKGSTAKGLTALEYLLFNRQATPDDVVATLTAEPQRMAYLVALSQDLAAKSADLLLLWSPTGDNRAQAFIDADFSANNVQGSISMLANEMIALLEEIVKTRIDYPLRGVYIQAQPDAVEAPYAAASLPLIVQNLRTIQDVFNAGIADYLNFLQSKSGNQNGDQLLTAKIDAQIEQSITAIEAIEMPLRDAVVDDPEAVRAVREEVKALLVLLKADMANLMSITVTFSDSDGD